MHEVAKHKIMHIAHAYMPATNCPCCIWEYNTKQRANSHLNTTKTCLPLVRFYATGGVGYGNKVATGAVLAQQKAKTCLKLNVPLRWPSSLPPGAVLPPAPLGYVTPEDLSAMNQQHNQEQDVIKWGTVEDLRHQAQQPDIKDINPFLGPIRAILLFDGGRREEKGSSHICARCE